MTTAYTMAPSVGGREGLGITARCVKHVYSWGADTAGNSSEVSIPKGLPRRCQEYPQPLPCGGHGLWLCPGPAAATDRWVPSQPSQLYLAGGGTGRGKKVVA